MDGLERGVRAKIYQRIIEQFITDPDLKKIFGKRWEVGYDTKQGFSIPETKIDPAISIMPTLSSQSWFSPSSQSGFMVLSIDYRMKGNNLNDGDILDMLDAFEAIERVLFNPDKDKRQAFKSALVALGAVTGEFTISQPARVQDAGQDGVVNMAQVQIEIKRNLNPNSGA